MEADPHEFASGHALGDYLYGKRLGAAGDDTLKPLVDCVTTLNELAAQPPAFWESILRRFALDIPHVTVVGHPSKQCGDDLSKACFLSRSMLSTFERFISTFHRWDRSAFAQETPTPKAEEKRLADQVVALKAQHPERLSQLQEELDACIKVCVLFLDCFNGEFRLFIVANVSVVA